MLASCIMFINYLSFCKYIYRNIGFLLKHAGNQNYQLLIGGQVFTLN